VQGEEDWVEARNLALRARTRFRGAGGKLCRNLVAEIEARSVKIARARLERAMA